MRWAIFSTVLLVAGGAAADPSPDDPAALAEAKAHFAEGRAAYQANEYERAIREFDAADALRPSPMLPYNIGLAWEQLGNGAKAIEQYRRYLALLPEANNRDEVEQRIAALAPTVEKSPPREDQPRPIHCPPGQSVTEDTAGHCCWAAQVWSKRRQACAGIPQCPAGLQPGGERCVRVARLPLIDADPYEEMPEPVRASSGTVPVRFVAKRSRYGYGVTVGKHTCATPCTLLLRPGEVSVTVSGAASYRTRIKVPPTPSVMIVESNQWNSFATGAVLVGLGTIAAIAGTAILATLPPSFASSYSTDLGYGALAMISAAVLLPIGIPYMAKLDANDIQLSPAGAILVGDGGGVRLTGIGVAPLQGGAATSVGFAF